MDPFDVLKADLDRHLAIAREGTAIHTVLALVKAVLEVGKAGDDDPADKWPPDEAVAGEDGTEVT